MPGLQPACPSCWWVQSALKDSSPSFLATKASSLGCGWGDGQFGSSPMSEPVAGTAVNPVDSSSFMTAE